MRPLGLAGLVLWLVVIAGGSPAVATVADDLCAPSADPCVVSSTLTIGPGSAIDLGGRALHFGGAARVAIGVGAVTIAAGPVRFLPGASITGGSGIGGSNFEVTSTGTISVEGSGSTKSRIDNRSPLGDRDSDNLKFRCAVPRP
jgi:hypothetical protein